MATRASEDSWSLKPYLLLEFDHRTFPSELEGFSGFALGRLRPGFSFASEKYPWLRAAVTVDYVGDHPPNVIDAFVRLRPWSWLEFTVGYSKPPLFASIVYEPVQAMPFGEVSPVVQAFHISRDAGADLHFLLPHLPIEGWLRISNGTGSPLGNDNALPAGYAALDLVLGRARKEASLAEHFWGLRLGVAGFIESAADRDSVKGQTALGFVYSRPVTVSGRREIGEAHAIIYAGPLRLRAETAVAREGRSFDDDGNASTPRLILPSVWSYGIAGEVAYSIIGQPRQVGAPPRGSDDGHNLSQENFWSGQALELAIRYDKLWLGREVAEIKSSGGDEWAASLKWWPTPVFFMTLGAYLSRYDVPPIEAPSSNDSWGVRLRASFFYGDSIGPQVGL